MEEPSVTSSTLNDNDFDYDKNECSDEDDTGPGKRMKKRVRQFSESDSDSDNEKVFDNFSDSRAKERFGNKVILEPVSESGSDNDNSKKHHGTLKESNSESESEVATTTSALKETIQTPMKNKRNKLKNKFQNLVNSRKSGSNSQTNHEHSKDKLSQGSDESSSDSAEPSSINQIKKKIKERISSIKTSICDPDTSSDEERSHHEAPQRQKKERRSIKLTSPKPAKMSAKQAMENMQKIKSESNRMLREQQVSLPYHRPKALSLKDIINRRKPALSSDGKALPIKMNEEQLKQYVLQLEQRQKEIMELCKSESEEDEVPAMDNKADNVLPNVQTLNEIVETKHDNIQNVPDILDINMEHTNTILDKEDNASNINSDHIDEAESKCTEQTSNLHLVENNNKEDLLEECGSSKSSMHNDSIEQEINADVVNTMRLNNDSEITVTNQHDGNETHTVTNLTEDSQLISLHLDTEKQSGENNEETVTTTSIREDKESVEMDVVEEIGFSDEDINMDEIDSIIENAEILKDCDNTEGVNSPMLIRDPETLKVNPRLTGAPGMVIDLDGGDPFTSKKLTGVELLKERFTYFAKLKTPEEMERDREKKLKPGTQHLKLKQELEEKIAEQRSLEWAKRLEEEKQHQMELRTLRGEASEEEDEIEKIESKLEKDETENVESPSESEEELLEDDICMKGKPRIKNPMVASEAEESDCDEDDEVASKTTGIDDDGAIDDDAVDDSGNNESGDESSEEESSESEDEQARPKKSRILKAFEDSDDEVEIIKLPEQDTVSASGKVSGANDEVKQLIGKEGQVIKDSQDDELQLAQRHKSLSGDMFSSQSSALFTTSENNIPKDVDDDKDLGTQTFSILNSGIPIDNGTEQHSPERLSVVCTTQPFEDNLDAVAAMCSGSFTQNLVDSQQPVTQVSQSQPIGEDILALCTGKFYDNQFVSPTEVNTEITQESFDDNNSGGTPKGTQNDIQQTSNLDVSTKQNEKQPEIDQECNEPKKREGYLLKSILDELDDPAFDSPKVNKFFNGNNQMKHKDQNVTNTQLKKKFIIDSDDETNETTVSSDKKKKFKKKKLENRALQISDDEEDELLLEEEEEEYVSDIEDDTNRMVEYDSEENEVEIKPQKPKKKHKGTDFFEQEAELTSEDEWVGSGDEDEADLDRMEREEGDDDTFHQGKLQRELGQIHMRDVLDQDKREVRIIQELLFEDGDLGDGHRQRKFRWKNADGEEETGTVPNELADTQEEEFESEEQWRKERHEREVFLKQLKNPAEAEENLNTSVNRTTIIKANLLSKTMSSLLMEVNNDTSKTESTVVAEKITNKDIPSPKKPFAIFKQNYHGSLLTRGRGALARLAALATPLAVDDDAPNIGSLGPTNRRNFVFTAITPDHDKPKITKRKADVNVGTPRLVKKMKTEDKPKYSKSLLDHLNG